MFNDTVSFNGGTRVEVIAVLANCGRDTDRARRALVTWIQHKQSKGRSTEHILRKLQDVESKFIKDTSLHNAFRDARAETFLPRPPDLPLPSSIKRRSDVSILQSAPSIRTSTSNHSRPTSLSSPPSRPPLDLTEPSPPPRSLAITSANPNTTRQTLPREVSRSPQLSRTLPIYIPGHRSPHGPDSPVMSSPEDSEPKRRHISDPLETTLRLRDLSTSPSATSTNFQLSPLPISPPWPMQRVPNAVLTTSPRRTSVSSSSRRATSPRTSPPDLPLPPIPPRADMHDQDVESRESHDPMPKNILPVPAEPPLPPTPVRPTSSHAPTPARPLPVQPVPSPVPSSEHIGIITENHPPHHLRESSGESLRGEIVRQDSPVFNDDDQPSQTAPPPYVDQQDGFPSSDDTSKFGDTLNRICGGSQEVRREVAKCIEFYPGYEPPYWQSRLQACGLNAEAAGYLVDEMCRQVDWRANRS